MQKTSQNIWHFRTNSLNLHSLNGTKGDPLAQLVEHNTFNVGVLGSNPKRITKRFDVVNELIAFKAKTLGIKQRKSV